MVKKILLIVGIIVLGVVPCSVSNAQNRVVNYTASQVSTKSNIFITPSTGTFIEGSTFEVPVYVNTEGNNINAVELHIKFDPSKLSIVKPSGGKSIIGLWVEPPSYDNTKGTAKIVGAIPGGITTDSGLIVTITFQAKASGEASVSFSDETKVLLNDGMGSPVTLNMGRASYSIVPQPPAGVEVFSETHPFQDHWYNNNSPVLGWMKDDGITGFSYVLDHEPNTVPPNSAMTASTSYAVENLTDGLWYFHIKAMKKGVWGNTTHFILRIDTQPPAEFKPTIDYLTAAVVNRFLVNYFTTDSLSGIDHYEVGVIDKSQSVTESPIFVQADSPYQLPFENSKNYRVIIRAFDRAGNTRDEPIDVAAPNVPVKFFVDHATEILAGLLILILGLILLHYIMAHRVIRRFRRAVQTFEAPEEMPQRQIIHEIEYVQKPLPPVQNPVIQNPVVMPQQPVVPEPQKVDESDIHVVSENSPENPFQKFQ